MTKQYIIYITIKKYKIKDGYQRGIMKIIDIIEDGYGVGKENRNGIFC